MRNRAYIFVTMGILGVGNGLVSAETGPRSQIAQTAGDVSLSQDLNTALSEPPTTGNEMRIGPGPQRETLQTPEFSSAPSIDDFASEPLFDLDQPVPFDGAYNDALNANIADPMGVHEIYSTGSMYMRGQWYVQQDATILIRSIMKDRAIARAYEGATPTLHSLNVSSAPLRFQPGMRATLGRIIGVDTANRQHSVELSFLGLFDWDNSHTIRNVEFANNGAAALTNRVSTTLAGDPLTQDQRTGIRDSGGGLLINVPGFTTTDTHTINYAADFNNYELNYRLLGRPARDRAALQPDGAWVRFASSSQIKSVFAGLRGTTLNESFLYTSAGSGTGIDGVDRGLYEVRLNNRLFGFQIGGQITERHQNWSMGVKGKLGGLVNFARRNSLYDGIEGISTAAGAIATNNVTMREELHDEHLTFLGETGAYATYELSARAGFRLSYDAIYLSGLAVATPNLGLGNSLGPFNIESGLLLHGLSAGYEMVW